MLNKFMFWQESLPREYARIFSFDNFSRTQKHVLAKALDMGQDTDGYAPVGSYVRLYIKDVSAGVASKLCILSKKMPLIASGLLQHESKISVLHCRLLHFESFFIFCIVLRDIFYYLTIFIFISLASGSMIRMMLLLKQRKNSYFILATVSLYQGNFLSYLCC